jgi:predicted AAA+ superfamily ATPase
MLIEKIPESFPRTIYLDRIKPFIAKNLIKVLSGQRRVGKSYLLFQIMEIVRKEYSDAPIIYINKEDLQFDGIKNYRDLHDYVSQFLQAGKKNFLFIDEIQDIEEFDKALRSFVLNPDLDIYCTGSNAHLLSSDIAGNLSGRAIEIEIYSLSYTEFLTFHHLNNSEDALEKFLQFGGLPYLIHLELNQEVAYEYLKNIYSTVVFRDVINRFGVRNTVFLEKLIVYLASNIGSLFSAKKISDYLKSQKINIPSNQVQTYISHLKNAFLIHQVARYDIEGKRLFEIGEKYYFENLGIRNALWGYRLQDAGKIMENAVYNQLLIDGFDVKIGILGDSEIDFIAEKQHEKIYIQVALSLIEANTIEREFNNLLKIKDNYPKVVICRNAGNVNTFEGVKILDFRDYLMNGFGKL